MSRILDQAETSLGTGLPRIAAALVLLVVGLLLARLIGRLLGRRLEAAGLDGLAERLGVHDSLERFGLPRSVSRLLGRIVRVGITIVVVLAAVSLLGLAVLDDAINQAVVYLPRILTALALLLAGIVIGTFAKGRTDRLARQMDLPDVTGRAVELLIIAVFAVTALAQLGVSTSVLTLLVGLLLGGVVAAFALAFGLGGREVARALSSGRFVRESYDVGDTIAVAGHRGEITAIEPSFTVLRTTSGTTVRIPNHLLVESVVESFED